MARLSQYRSQVGLNPAPMPTAQPRDYMAGAIEQFGSDLTNMAASFMERDQKRTQFEQDTAYRHMLAQQDNALFENAQNIAEGGRGFTDDHLAGFDSATENFLSTIEDEDRRAQYAANLQVDRERAMLSAAKLERTELVRFQANELEAQGEQAAVDILNNPGMFEETLAGLEASVRASSLSAPAQAELLDALSDQSVASYLEAIRSDPIRVMRETGASLKELPPDARAAAMVRGLDEHGVIGQTVNTRSEGARAGTHGMQVTDLNRLAASRGIKNDMTAGEWDVALSDPATARLYAQMRLEEIVKSGVKDPEDVYAAFYMGEEFVADGWAYGDLPPAVATAVRSMSGAVKAVGVASADVALLDSSTGVALDPSRFDDIDPALTKALRVSLAQAGITKVKINDAERAHDAGYGAKNSQHIVSTRDAQGNEVSTGRSGAFDVDVSNLTHKQRVALIEAFSANGVTGIGVYKNTIHVDRGPRRYWGPDYHKESAPSWAKDALNRHMTGRIADAPKNNVDPRLRNASVATIASAQNDALKALTSGGKSTTTIRAEGKQTVADYIASVEAGLEPPVTSSQLDNALAVLTPEQQQTSRNNIVVAESVADLTAGASSSSEEDLQALLNLAANPDNGGANTVVGQRIIAGVEERVEEIRTARREDPVGSAFEMPGVEDEWIALTAGGGLQLDGTTGAASMEAFIQRVTDIQERQFLLPPSLVKHLPERELYAIASEIATLTRDPDMEPALIRQKTEDYITLTQKAFGRFTDEVLADALELLEDSAKTSPEDYLKSQLPRIARAAAADPSTETPDSAMIGPPDPEGLPAVEQDSEVAFSSYIRLPTEADRAAYLADLPMDVQEYIRKRIK